MIRAFTSGFRTSVPDSRLMCASHDSPPNVVDSTVAETTPRPVPAMSFTSASRVAARSRMSSGLSHATTPYASKKISSTSAPCTRARFTSMDGAGGTAFRPTPLAS